jgi:hypothetical protein
MKRTTTLLSLLLLCACAKPGSSGGGPIGGTNTIEANSACGSPWTANMCGETLNGAQCQISYTDVATQELVTLVEGQTYIGTSCSFEMKNGEPVQTTSAPFVGGGGGVAR